MKIIRTLDVTENQFYDYLESQVIHEIQKNTGRHVSPNDLKAGMQYAKSDEKGKTVVKIKIDDYQRGKKYQVTSETPLDSVQVTYLTQQKGSKIQVTFFETIDRDTSHAKSRLFRWISQTLMLGRMASTLMTIEEDILKNKK